MALNQLGVLDLSIVTDLLIQTITNSWNSSPLWGSLPDESFFIPSISGQTPESVRSAGGCQITVSLIHIESNKFNRNFVYPPPAQPPPLNPTSPRVRSIVPYLASRPRPFLLPSAPSSDQNYHQEQQAMSVVLRCFHENPVIRANVVIPGSPSKSAQEEFTVTMEIETADSISRLWQAITAPLPPLAAVSRRRSNSLTPPAQAGPATPVRKYGLAVEPAGFPLATAGEVFGTTSTAVFVPPSGDPASVSVDYSPATVAPGQRFFMQGAGLNQGAGVSTVPNPGTSFRVYLLLPPDYKTETEVTAWKTPDSLPASPIQTASRIVLDLPSVVGALPANAPRRRASMRCAPAARLRRISSRIAPVRRPSTWPRGVEACPRRPPTRFCQETGGTYTVTGMGFIAGSTQLFLSAPCRFTYVPGAAASGRAIFRERYSHHHSFQRPLDLTLGIIRHTGACQRSGIAARAVDQGVDSHGNHGQNHRTGGGPSGRGSDAPANTAARPPAPALDGLRFRTGG